MSLKISGISKKSVDYNNFSIFISHSIRYLFIFSLCIRFKSANSKCFREFWMISYRCWYWKNLNRCRFFSVIKFFGFFRTTVLYQHFDNFCQLEVIAKTVSAFFSYCVFNIIIIISEIKQMVCNKLRQHFVKLKQIRIDEHNRKGSFLKDVQKHIFFDLKYSRHSKF